MKQFKVRSYYQVKNKLWKEDSRIFDDLKELSVKCKCGKSIAFTYRQSYKICSECGRKVNNTTKAYFKYKLRGELVNEKSK